ncbi:MAG TPA: GlsB/YeaQ/YmgE family stress response membrane protein [Candidatus Limnocylindrales bacterium]|nr:GlsB/YeaQ/YmgE family stress response membrane protein [Candidatus Limnocylindrales bacterium]
MPPDLNPIAWIVIGLIAGGVAGWFVPGRERSGCLGTTVIGIVGGLLGGWIWTDLLNQNQAGGFLGALLIAVLGSAIVLLIFRAVSGQRD